MKKKLFFLPILMVSLTLCSQINDKHGKKGFKGNLLNKDSMAVRFQRAKDSIDNIEKNIEWQNNTRNLEEVMKTVEKRKKKDKTKAILYIVIGIGMMMVLIFALLRRKAGKKANG